MSFYYAIAVSLVNESLLGIAPMDIDANAFKALSSPTMLLRMLRENLHIGIAFVELIAFGYDLEYSTISA